MMNQKNILKALAISVVVNVLYTFYISSTSLIEQGKRLGFLDEGTGRLGAFMQASKIIDGFWPHLIEGWAYSFGLSFASCLLLLLTISTSEK
ncbi:MAG: hypothetical protein P8171_13230 [Candidatus Thiodiazotropha sp.]